MYAIRSYYEGREVFHRQVRHHISGQVTGLGSLFRIHVHNRPLSDYRSMLMTDAEKNLLARIVGHMRDNGVFVNERGVCSLSTPMTEAEIDAFP